MSEYVADLEARLRERTAYLAMRRAWLRMLEPGFDKGILKIEYRDALDADIAATMAQITAIAMQLDMVERVTTRGALS